MDLYELRPRSRAEAILPMINLVFLLLIFFLMAATLAPTPPARVEPPQVEGARRLSEPAALRVSLGADGRAVFEGERGEAALALLAGRLKNGADVAIHADRAAPAGALAGVLAALAERGAGRIWLVTGAGG